MEITEEIKTNEPKEFSQAEKDDLFLQLVRGKDITEVIETKRGKFTVKYPKQKDLIKIGRLIAFKHNGLNANSFDEDTESLIRITSYLEICVVDGEAWYKNAKNEKQNWNWEEVPDTAFLSELFVKAQEFRRKVEGTFKGSERKETAGVLADKGDSDYVGEGLFSDFTGGGKSE